ncbi:MAG TPA: glycoside hydrolase family 125 protein [Acidobacteriaceae bacterium]|nr:glycoside hydrolase family 125 protein [Acidobacteriaceae bacterium]
MTRRSLLSSAAAAGVIAAGRPFAAMFQMQVENGRPAPQDRRFRSAAVDAAILRVKRQIADPMLASMFERCLPNTLDTTITFSTADRMPDTVVITGDIDAMWLRDSSAQVWPYLQFAREDTHLAEMLEGVIRRQARCLLIDSYANAFTRKTSDPALSWARNDATAMVPGVAERKWEVDSLCHVLRLAHGYWKATGSARPFDSTWKAAAHKIVATLTEQQRMNGPGPYSFQRKAQAPTDSLPLKGYGNPARPVGMIFSGFRPSDDACIYPFLIPANLFAVHALTGLREMAAAVLNDAELAQSCDVLVKTVPAALARYGTVQHSEAGRIWAYEVDGYGNALMMDDANIPSLLGLPYLGACAVDDPLYQRTRGFALSPANPYFFEGTAAEGIGGPHVGLNSIWPMSIIVRAMTSDDDREILKCLRWLRDTTAGTGFMHESFFKDDATKFTRSWFAWANSLFGELILTLAEKRPQLLRADLRG